MAKRKKEPVDHTKCAFCGKDLPSQGADWDEFFAKVVSKQPNTKSICAECGEKSRRGPVKY